jgi:DNA gyrase/topoisomerase IV subunit A
MVAWIAQVRQQPEAAADIAADIIEALAERLMALERQNERLRDELLRQRYKWEGGLGSARKGGAAEQIATLTRRIQDLEQQLERRAPLAPEQLTRWFLVVTLDGRGARMLLPSAEAWQSQGTTEFVAPHLRPRYLHVVTEPSQLLVFTDKGRAMRLDVGDIEADKSPINYLGLLPGLALDLDESISALISLPVTFNRLNLITRKGYVRSFSQAEVESLLERNLPLHSSPVEGDYPAFAVPSDGKSELLVASRQGKGVRFPERAIGVRPSPGIKLDRGDVVAGAAVVQDDIIVLLMNAHGRAARREMAGFGAHPTAGNRGKILTRIEDLVALALVGQDDRLWLLTAAGQLRMVPAAKVSSGPGASGGRSVVALEKDRLVSLAVERVV